MGKYPKLRMPVIAIQSTIVLGQVVRAIKEFNR